MNPKVDFYFQKAGQWQEAIEQLREICLGCGLEEELKWGTPCYTDAGANIVLIHTFKEYCALLFFKGALLRDMHGILIQQTEHVQAARQIRFTSLAEVEERVSVVKAHILEAIEVERAGLKVELKQTNEFVVAEEFQQQLDEHPALRAAFEGLTPGRQRGYLLYFSSPKQAKTRLARIEKYWDQILAGKGLED